MYTIKDMLYGIAIGDAVGVPYEFEKRGNFNCDDMIGYGTHLQPIGTWSDDTSLTLCLAETMKKNDINYDKIAKNMVSWLKKRQFLAGRALFDVGRCTCTAINNMYDGLDPVECGPSDLNSNGNGALMRIAPLVYYLMYKKDEGERHRIIANVASMTHGHEINIIGCHIFIEYLISLYHTKDKQEAYIQMQEKMKEYYKQHPSEYIDKYDRLIKTDISKYREDEIDSSGYVVSTLESALYCFLNTATYKDCIIKAVNLGLDTDTTAAVAGALAGPYYGIDGIPSAWIENLQNKALIDKICNTFYFS